MCIAIATTAHPSYALIVIDNRDEFILRPTSRPHWWSSNRQDILSARDLQRAEQGTWLGINKSGKFAVLTNFRESGPNLENPVEGQKSRGAMVTAWLTSAKDESLVEFIKRLFEDDGVKGVGGFSLVCGRFTKHVGKTTKQLKPFAIVSNRSISADDVPWIAHRRGEVYGLSNTSYDDPVAWPKVEMGKEKVLQVIKEVLDNGMGEETLVEKLFAVLDTDTLPPQKGETFEEYLSQLRNSIFIPKIDDSKKSDEASVVGPVYKTKPNKEHMAQHRSRQRKTPDSEAGIAKPGSYGTQRQTVILVDWDGNVTFRERALWDDCGRPIVRGKGDLKFEFQIDGWNN